ncbi:uncharacterized protein TNCV_637891 [Trichonephila clavipes]|nr:uncharacterized protein TNCV_637891 [Trichonephila clavipes]
MASAVLTNPTRVPQGTNWGSGPAMEESENDVGSLKQLFLYADEHYLAVKLPLGDHLGVVLHGVEEYHQRNASPLRIHASHLKWTGYHRLLIPRPLHQLYGQCDVEQYRGTVPLTRAPPYPYTVIICPRNKPGFIPKATFCHSVTFDIDLAWHH